MRSLRVWYWRRLADIKVSAWPLAGLCVDLHSTLFWKIGCFLLRRPRGVYSIVDDRAITLNKITSCFLFFVQRTFQLIGIQYSFLITLIWLKIFHCVYLNNFLFHFVFENRRNIFLLIYFISPYKQIFALNFEQFNHCFAIFWFFG